MPTINRQPLKQRPVPYQHDNVSAPYYNSMQWRNLRNYYIKRHPLCERCEQLGKTTLAQECHHRTPFLQGTTDEERWELLLSETNLMSVCRECHLTLHGMKKYK